RENTPAQIRGEATAKRAARGQAVTRFTNAKFKPTPRLRGVAKYLFELAIVGASYFVLAHGASALSSIYSTPIPIWPPAGLALAAVLLRGVRVWPAVFAAAFATGLPAGTLLVAPAIVLWALADYRGFDSDKVLSSIVGIIATSLVGLVAFSPLFEDSAVRNALAFLAVLPLLWTALRCGERDTATAVLILSCFAVW